MRRRSEATLVALFEGRVVESLAVRQDFGAGTVGCDTCTARLGAGDAVSAALTCYEGHSWEIAGVHCRDHGVGTVAAAMGVRAESQAVVAARLTDGAYDPPRGAPEGRALLLAGVTVLDHSPPAEGWDRG